ncbi:MAG: hypothetical protein U1F83_00225 [Verrucomicrobiota bacterium]
MNRLLAGHLRGQHQRLAAIALALVLSLGCRPGGHAQGLINFINSASTLITINSNGLPVGTLGGQPGTFRFELFIAPAGTLDPAGFTATGLIATNLASPGRLSAGVQRAVPGAPLGGTGAILVRGWSANLGSNYASALVAWRNFEPGYLGESSIAPNFLFGGDGDQGAVPTSPAFGGSSGIQSGFALLNSGCLSCPPYWMHVEAYTAATTVVFGSDVTIFGGASPYHPRGILRFQWFKNGSPITGANNEDLTLANVALGDSGSYFLTAHDDDNSGMSDIVSLTVIIPALAATLSSPAYTANNQFQFTVTGSAGSNYVVQVATNLSPPTTWVSLFTNAAPFTFVDSNAQNFPQRFYRAQTR